MEKIIRNGLLILSLVIPLYSMAQPTCSFEHFSIDEGLPQLTISDIIQDQKGFIWLATFDGLSQFDGYEFHNYKVQPGDPISMKSNRIDRISEDRYGRIWLELYDGEAHCFDPKTKQFWGLPGSTDPEESPFVPSNVSVQPSGLVWILSNDNGCYCISDSIFTLHRYREGLNNLINNTINLVYEDRKGNSWLLTGNGLQLLPEGEYTNGNIYFNCPSADKGARHEFFSAVELDQEIWFGSDRGRIERFQKKDNRFLSLDLKVPSAVTHLSKLNNENLLISTASDGFFTYQLFTGELRAFNQSTIKELRTNTINVVFVKSPDQLWFSTSEIGIYQYNFRTDRLSFFRVSTEETAVPVLPTSPFVIKDANNRLWVHPFGGGFSLYNETTNTLEPFFNRPDTPGRRFSNVLHSAYSDRQGNLWFCSMSNGLEKIVFNRSAFSSFQISEPGSAVNSDNIRAVYEDPQGYLWLATKGNNRIVVLDKNRNRIGDLAPDGEIRKNAQWTCATYCFFTDSNHNLWLGTRGDGLFKLSPKKTALSFNVEHFTHQEKDLNSISDNNIYSIFQDRAGRIWVGTFGGGINLIDPNSPKETRFLNHLNGFLNYPIELAPKVRCLTEDRHGHIWVGTTNGLLVFDEAFQSADSISFRYYIREAGNSNSLGNNDVIALCPTREGEMYIGTSGSGLNKVLSLDSKGYPLQFRSYTTKHGIPSDLIQAIAEDQRGKLWITTQTELARFDPQTDNSETFAEARSLLSGHYFSEAGQCVTRSGQILFGFSNGVLSFMPDEIKTNLYAPYIAFTNLHLFNKEASIGTNSPLSVSIDDCSKLELTHKQNYFTIGFSALDFANPKVIQYAYKLEGFDQEWNYVQKQRIASYTNLPKGKYLFRVKSTNSQGVWVENERQLPIVIKPSFWETPLAYFLYFFISGLIIFLIDYNLMIIYRLKTKVNLEKRMSEMKMKFFTDISHEIRTPLTMISAPVDYLIHDNRTPDTVKKQLNFISQNTSKMLHLVNQILDFRKLQDRPLAVSEVQLAPFVMEIFHLFEELAEEQQIDFTFDNQAGNATIWIDKESLEKMVSNLLSNAFKYAASGKSIEISIKKEEKYLVLKVSDKGPGITKEKQKRLFERFTSFNDDASKPSTGIGLALVKELADKHSAKVLVDSEPGRGSCFSLLFQTGTAHFSSDVELIGARPQQEKPSESPARKTENTSREPISESVPTMLLVEDDADLRQFLKSILEQDYRVVEAEDGLQGLKMASDENPDFIVSDIMMPNLDGIGLLKQLRNNIDTSHIPIVLLTAKADIESQLEGLTYGADDYITKPFSVPYFKTRIVNLLNQRKRLQEIFGESRPGGFIDVHPKPYLITSHDEEIIEKVLNCIEANIDNGNFTVEDLSMAVGMGRTTLFNKLKSLTGLSPVEFIRDLRLKRAAQLIRDSRLMIKEVSYMNGFSDIKYFNKSFKAKFGMTPIEYRNQDR